MASERACICLTARFDVLAGMDFNVTPGERRKGLLFFVLWRGVIKGGIGNECFQLERELENLLVSYFDFYCWNRNSNRACQFGLICQHLVLGIRISGGSRVENV